MTGLEELLLLAITNSPVFAAGPGPMLSMMAVCSVPPPLTILIHPLRLTDDWRQAKTRRELVEAMTRTAATDSLGARLAAQALGESLLAGVRRPGENVVDLDIVPGDEPMPGLGTCLLPFVSPRGKTETDPGAPIAAGDIVATTWRGVPWKMGKVFLGMRGSQALFYQHNPAVAFEVPLRLVTHAVRLRGPAVRRDQLPANVVNLMDMLDPSGDRLPRVRSVNVGQAMVLNELFLALRALPE